MPFQTLIDAEPDGGLAQEAEEGEAMRRGEEAGEGKADRTMRTSVGVGSSASGHTYEELAPVGGRARFYARFHGGLLCVLCRGRGPEEHSVSR